MKIQIIKLSYFSILFIVFYLVSLYIPWNYYKNNIKLESYETTKGVNIDKISNPVPNRKYFNKYNNTVKIYSGSYPNIIKEVKIDSIGLFSKSI